MPFVGSKLKKRSQRIEFIFSGVILVKIRNAWWLLLLFASFIFAACSETVTANVDGEYYGNGQHYAEVREVKSYKCCAKARGRSCVRRFPKWA